jgi:hypothetical protein
MSDPFQPSDEEKRYHEAYDLEYMLSTWREDPTNGAKEAVTGIEELKSLGENVVIRREGRKNIVTATFRRNLRRNRGRR